MLSIAEKSKAGNVTPFPAYFIERRPSTMSKNAKTDRVKVTVADSGIVTIITAQKKVVVIISDTGNVTTMTSEPP